jgi:DNA invertase Pin-like site-specific DNA recombinase
MLTAAIYARFSDEQQRATSIEDQVRRCREVAARYGVTVAESLVFMDAAITGKSIGTAKRPGYRRLLDAADARQMDVIIVDEISRLTRSPAEGARLLEFAEDTGLRFITADGIDSDRDGWKMLWMFKLTAGANEVDATAHRTRRGMLGQLERGYQIAQPPYGYRSRKDETDAGGTRGTFWEVKPDEAEVIQLMYRLRIDGLSGTMIAEHLNKRGVLPPGQHRKDAAGYWRSATVLRVLANPIYRGVFVWNGSPLTQHKAKRKRKPLEQKHFPRPALRMVSDEDWAKANPGFDELYTRKYSPRGGGKRLFSGLVRCGDCSALCSPGTGSGKGSLYCPQCESAVRAGGKASWIGYSSVAAGTEALRWLLHRVFSPGATRDAFRARLEDRLRAGPEKELTTLKDDLARAETKLAHVKRLLVDFPKQHELFAADFKTAATEREQLLAKFERATKMSQAIDESVVKAQCDVDVLKVVDHLLEEGSVEPYKLKATLRRLLSRFELVARPAKGVSVFRIGVRPGVLLAEATNTAVVDREEVAFEVRVSTGAARPVVWKVSAVPWAAPEGAEEAAITAPADATAP